MFPLRLKTPCSLDDITFEQYKQIRQKKARHLSDIELKKRAQQVNGQKTSRCKVISSTYVRNEYVVEYSKRRANGICQLCNNPAPFKNVIGVPYLECHHIQWLSKGGTDTIYNTVALCPNCHRKMHILNLEYDKLFLSKQVKK